MTIASDNIVCEDGQRGAVVQRTTAANGESQLVIALDDGRRLVVPEDLLIARDDGTRFLPLSAAALALPGAANAPAGTDDQIVIPVVVEELNVEKRRIARGIVRIHKRVETREEVVDEPLIREEMDVERVAIDRLVEGDVPQARQEGDVLIIPILEEALVVEKRLLLREELRVTKRRTTISNPQPVTLRREVVDIERVAAPPGQAEEASVAPNRPAPG
jgi:uncharacterized protein (TIGR02271 family)